MEILRNGRCISVPRGAPLMLNVTLSAPPPAEPHEAPPSLQRCRRARRVCSRRDWRVGPFGAERPLTVLGARSGLAAVFSVPKRLFVSQGNLKLLKPLKVRSACSLLPDVAPAGIRE
jgi:hypothetical protein